MIGAGENGFKFERPSRPIHSGYTGVRYFDCDKTVAYYGETGAVI